MKSFLYENVEDDDEEEDEEEEEVIVAKPRTPRSRKRQQHSQEEVEEPRATSPRRSSSSSTYSNPYQKTYPYETSGQELYTAPQVSYPGQSSNSGRSRIDVRAEQDPTPTPTTPSRSTNQSAALPMRRTVNNRQPVQPRQEYSTVISPIFGNMAEEEKNPRAIHDAVNLSKPAEPGGISQIISPMYGKTTVSAPASPIIQVPATTQRAKMITPSPTTPNRAKKAAPSKESKRVQQATNRIISTRPQAIQKQMQAIHYEEEEGYEDYEMEGVVQQTPSSYSVSPTHRPEILEEAMEEMDIQERADQIANEHLSNQPNQQVSAQTTPVEEEVEAKTAPRPARYLDLSSYLSRGSNNKKNGKK